MADRAEQALHLLALDPVAEVLQDPNSYGFRKGRSYGRSRRWGKRCTFRRHQTQEKMTKSYKYRSSIASISRAIEG